MKAIVIAGTTSGVGKTTIAMGIMAALRRRGLKVQPFKVGPDYMDPSYHTWVTGQPCRNLDTWMIPKDAVIELFTRAMAGKDIAVIEGVMGLYDGHSATDDEGSTAEAAKLLGAPVLLVVDSRKAARSVAAMVGGYKQFDPALNLAGVILNGIGGEGHLRICRDAIGHYNGLLLVGFLRRSEKLGLAERHLGLVPTVEDAPRLEMVDELVAQIETNFDILAILHLAEETSVPTVRTSLFPPKPLPPVVRIAIARDKPFSFYYQDSLDLLEAWGAELVPFSPLKESTLPSGISGIYIGGGFPEVYAAELAANQPMKESIKKAAALGTPVYAECGGLMYLGESIRDMQGISHAMAGVIPISSRIDSPRLSLGYRTVTARSDGPLLCRGETVRGHEFHWSVLEPGHPEMNGYQVEGREGPEGFQMGSVFASYIHIHLGSRPGLAQRFIQVCRA